MTTSASLRTELDRARRRLNRAIARLDDDDDYARPIAPGGWSVHEVLIHIAHWDEVGRRTVSELGRGQSPTRYVTDVDRFNAEAVRQGLGAPDESLALLDSNRSGLLQALDAAPPETWFELRVSTTGESVSIADLLATWTRHDDEHAAELEAFLARTRCPPP